MNVTHDTPRALTEGERTAVVVTAAVTGLLGLVGFVNSFAGVASAAAPSFGWLAWTVPVGIDLGIAVFSALDIVVSRLGTRVRWLRLVPWTLTAATVYLNVAVYLGDWFAVVAHALLPLLWVIAVEVGAHVIRKRADLSKPNRMDGIRRSRWLLAPLPTLALWRRMVLWEIRSYPDALGRERARILAKTDLQDRYGALWRWKATRRERALYRLGELAPADAPIHDESARTRGRSTKPPTVDSLLPLGRRIAADLARQGKSLTRDGLRDAIRNTGQSISTDRAGALLDRLRTKRAVQSGEAA